MVLTTLYVYDARNRLIRIDPNDDTTYDSNGNATGGTSDDTTYTYDDSDNRLSETTNGSTTTSVLDTYSPTGYAQILESWQGGSTPASTFLLGNQTLAQNAGGTVSYLMPDGHGSTRQLTAYTASSSTNGHAIARYDYDAFGNQLTFTASTHAPNSASTIFLYDGEPSDPITGNYRMGLAGRDYRPASGDFTQRDPTIFGPGEVMNANPYVFVGGNPINLYDPSGHISATNLLNNLFGDEFTGAAISVSQNLNDPFSLAAFHEWFTGVETGVISSYIRALANLTALTLETELDLYMTFADVCFAAGTQVIVGTSQDGSYLTRSIEELRPGDVVLSRNEHEPAGDLAFRPIANLFRNVSDHLRILQIRAEDGNVATIRTTDNHRFWVEGLGWVRAGAIGFGARVRRPHGADATVISSDREAHPQTIAVYNIEVQEDHTFFVAEGPANQIGVWVHNTGDCNAEEGEGSSDLYALSETPASIESYRMGEQQGREFAVNELGLSEAGWVNASEFESLNTSIHDTGHGIDDVRIDAEGNYWVTEYKGGEGSKLGEGQMSKEWLQIKIDELKRERNPWGNKLEAAWAAGKLRGVAIKTPTPGQTHVMQTWNYGVQ